MGNPMEKYIPESELRTFIEEQWKVYRDSIHYLQHVMGHVPIRFVRSGDPLTEEQKISEARQGATYGATAHILNQLEALINDYGSEGFEDDSE